jgi:hypothetical protein
MANNLNRIKAPKIHTHFLEKSIEKKQKKAAALIVNKSHILFNPLPISSKCTTKVVKKSLFPPLDCITDR